MRTDIFDAITAELHAAQENFPPMRSEHEGYAIILEELDEAWEEIKKNPRRRDKAAIRREMVQVAAMCIRFLEDLT